MRACAGSSPLARGTPLNLCLGRLPIRFIPAYAGNSSRSKASIFVGAVHPRLRGELKAKLYPELCQDGSSPLTRGTPSASPIIQFIIRFIPAYAGNSLFPPFAPRRLPVHPRLRGELCKIGDGSMTTSGSSPLTRGTLTFCNPPNIQCRFIPAYAGNSLRRRGKESVRPVHPRLRGEL